MAQKEGAGDVTKRLGFEVFFETGGGEFAIEI